MTPFFKLKWTRPSRTQRDNTSSGSSRTTPDPCRSLVIWPNRNLNRQSEGTEVVLRWVGKMLDDTLIHLGLRTVDLCTNSISLRSPIRGRILNRPLRLHKLTTVDRTVSIHWLVPVQEEEEEDTTTLTNSNTIRLRILKITTMITYPPPIRR
jgi:hypothetical protein